MRNDSAQNTKAKTGISKLKTFPAGRGKFILGDCLESMKTMESNSITLAFTSPPYHNAINYNEHIKKINGEIQFWQRSDFPYQLYKKFLVNRFRELYRIIQPGGHNVVNISPVAWNGERIPLPFHFVGWMEEVGWKFKEDIIWKKKVVKDKRSGVLMQHPYPGYYYPSLAVEYIFVFQKPAIKQDKNNIYYYRSQKEKNENTISLKNYQEVSKNIWEIRPVSPNENLHPCPFPEELANLIIQFYSYKNDIVIDIFSGSGVTNIAAEKLGRNHIGLEVKEEYINYGLDFIHQAEDLFND